MMTLQGGDREITNDDTCRRAFLKINLFIV